MKTMMNIKAINLDEEDLDEFIYEFHERVLVIEPEQNERPEWDWIRRK